MIILLIAMLFCHIIDDYKLQGILAQFKQKSWWQEHASDTLYKYDYIIALIEHAFCWACSIHIPVLVYCLATNRTIGTAVWVIAFIFNVVIHAHVDHLKANAHKINLVQDQLAHVIQILLTWFVYILAC